jgi:hypothetical protein
MEQENRRAGTSVIRPFEECHVAAAAVKKIFGGPAWGCILGDFSNLDGFDAVFFDPLPDGHTAHPQYAGRLAEHAHQVFTFPQLRPIVAIDPMHGWVGRAKDFRR